MRDLTQSEAEDCAGACGMIRVRPHVCSSYVHVWVPIGTVQEVNSLGDGGNRFRSPYFWLGKLLDRLEIIRPGLAIFSDEATPGEIVWCISEIIQGNPPKLKLPLMVNENLCLALCKAIFKYQVQRRKNED